MRSWSFVHRHEFCDAKSPFPSSADFAQSVPVQSSHVWSWEHDLFALCRRRHIMRAAPGARIMRRCQEHRQADVLEKVNKRKFEEGKKS
jgi:hypothetical protein